jgi:ribonuclease HI
LLPAALTVNKWCHQALVRMVTLPGEHPLSKLVKRKDVGKLKKHKGPIHHLAKCYKLDARAFEKLPVAMRDPSRTGELPFNTRIAASKEDSAEEAKNTVEEIQIFSDGSALEGKVGASAVLTHKGRPNRTLLYHLGRDSEHTVHEAELTGILLGLHLLKTEKDARIPVLVGVDNQAVIKAFDSELRSPGHHIAHEILRQANRLKKKGRRTKYALTICWTAGHVGIEGNEDADEKAKEVAKGCSSDTKLLPPYLRKALLINPAAVKMAHYAKLKEEWKDTWNNSVRGRALAQIEESTPST